MQPHYLTPGLVLCVREPKEYPLVVPSLMGAEIPQEGPLLLSSHPGGQDPSDPHPCWRSGHPAPRPGSPRILRWARCRETFIRSSSVNRRHSGARGGGGVRGGGGAASVYPHKAISLLWSLIVSDRSPEFSAEASPGADPEGASSLHHLEQTQGAWCTLPFTRPGADPEVRLPSPMP